MNAPAMPLLWKDLARNLAGGFRLITFRRVDRNDFRCGLPQLLALIALGVLLGIADDVIRNGLEGRWSIGGFVQEGFYNALLLAAGAILALAFRQPHLALAIPCVVASGAPFYELLNLGEWAVQRLTEDLSPVVDFALIAGLTLWMLVWFWRSVNVSLFPRLPQPRARAALGTAVLALALYLPHFFLPTASFWGTANDAAPAGDAGTPSVVSEEALTAQGPMLDQALDELEDQRAGTTDLYFIGFSPNAEEDAFRADLDTAREVVERQFDAKGRSLSLINSRQTLLDEPLATVSNLKSALASVAEIINPEEDVVFLYLTARGTREHEIEANFPPLDLHTLTPTALGRAFAEAGIKWRVIVVSACYSGAFIEPLKDSNTLIVTASASDKSSFACAAGGDPAFFGKAFFDQALRDQRSLVEAFARTRELIAAREKKLGLPASDPQIYVGADIAEKLAEFEQEAPRRRPGMMVRATPRDGGES
jgi:hypothetical protein